MQSRWLTRRERQWPQPTSLIPSHSTQVRKLLSLKPFLQLCLRPLQSAVIQEFA